MERYPIDDDGDDALEGWSRFGFSVFTDRAAGVWFFGAPGIVVTWCRRLWWRIDLVRLGPWEIQP